MITDQDQSIINHYKDSLTTNLKNVKIEDLTVWVDPLDGTKEYTEGYLDHVTVLVGIAVGNIYRFIKFRKLQLYRKEIYDNWNQDIRTLPKNVVQTNLPSLSITYIF